MSASSTAATRTADAAILQAAAALERDAEQLAESIARAMHDAVFEPPADPQIREELRRGALVHARGFIAALRRGEPFDQIPPAPEALAAARSLARADRSMQPVLRALHFGHQAFLDALSGKLVEHESRDEVRSTAARMAQQHTFRWIDGLARQLAVAYEEEKARSAGDSAAARMSLVRSVLRGETHDADAVSRAIGFELGRRHVGLVLWTTAAPEQPTALPALYEAAAAVGELSGGGRPLAVPAGSGVLWAWVSGGADIDKRALDAWGAIARRLGVHIAAGERAGGVGGFKTSHEEAAEARRVALSSGPAAPRVWRYRDVELLALVTANRAAAARFVRRELGALAEVGEHHLRLRETLRAYLECGSSRQVAAATLGVHPNTISNRLHACAELLGRDAEAGGAELLVALRIRELQS